MVRGRRRELGRLLVGGCIRSFWRQILRRQIFEVVFLEKERGRGGVEGFTAFLALFGGGEEDLCGMH